LILSFVIPLASVKAAQVKTIRPAVFNRIFKTVSSENQASVLPVYRKTLENRNGLIERFNRSYREAVLDMFVFQSLSGRDLLQ
jgi:hypothetical protein